MIDVVIFILVGTIAGYVLRLAQESWEENHDID
jgi:hypothetical protein